MKLVTGYKGIAHITSGDVGAYNASVVGAGQYVLNSGENFKATVVSNNQVKIGCGDILLNGRHITIDKGLEEDLTFDNNSASTNRIDLIVVRYSKATGTGIENAELVVIKGTATAGTASDPSYNVGNILNGDEIVDMPLYKVAFTGITMETPVALFETLDSIEALKGVLNSSLATMKQDLTSGLNAKANTGHNHDDRYYTESEINTKLSGKSDTGHNHDTRYYTETEVNNLLAKKSDTSHNHNNNYLALAGGTVTGALTVNGAMTVKSNIINGSADGNFKIKCPSHSINGYSVGGIYSYDTTGEGYKSVHGLSFVQLSSDKVKENIVDITDEEALKILNVDVVSFDYKEKFGGQKNNYGVIAEEVVDIIPYAVDVPDNYKEEEFDEEKGVEQPILSVDYSRFVPYLIKMIQIQQKEIEELKK